MKDWSARGGKKELGKEKGEWPEEAVLLKSVCITDKMADEWNSGKRRSLNCGVVDRLNYLKRRKERSYHYHEKA